MEFGDEIKAFERVGGGFMYGRREFKIPTEIFQDNAINAMDLVSSKMKTPQDQIDWFVSNLTNIPSYETYNPYAVVLGFLAVSWSSKQIDKKRFKDAISHISGFKITSADVLRYSRKWQDEWFVLML